MTTRADCDRCATLIVMRLLLGKGDDMKKDISDTLEAFAAIARGEAMLEVAEAMKDFGAPNGAKFVLDLARKARDDVEKIRTRIGGLC